jgi:hypothetical protein
MARSGTYIRLSIVERSHNFIYVTSDDVPELHLWGPPSFVLEQLEPALKILFKRNRGLDVEVVPGSTLDKFPQRSNGEIPDGYNILAQAA